MTPGARPFYFRMLRLRHLRPRPSVTFLLFEGSVGLSVLLAFADIVSWWGAFAIPAAVAVMVKLNDIVAGALIRPLAAAQLRTPRLLDGFAMGRSVVPRPSRLTTDIGTDDAVADPDARPPARGVAPVPSLDHVRGRRPMPGAREPEPPVPVLETAESTDIGAAITPDDGSLGGRVILDLGPNDTVSGTNQTKI